MLAEVDLTFFQTLVRIAEAIGCHTDLLQPSRVVPRDDLGADDCGGLVVKNTGDQSLDRIPVESNVVVDEQKEISARAHTR